MYTAKVYYFAMTQPQLFQIPLAPGDVTYTPDFVARDMVDYFKPTGRVLEPCRGDGAFTRYMPDAEWCEIQEGRDFFQWHKQADWIISNPPYSMFDEFLRHGLEVSRNVVYLVPFHTFFRAGTRIEMARIMGWIKHIRFYGAGGKLGFPMGNPVGAMHFQRGYMGDTSWSWYGDDKCGTT